MKRALLILGIVLTAVSCTTISPGAARAEAELLVRELSLGNVDEALAISARPFLFESEIIESEAILRELLTGAQGWGLDAASVSEDPLPDDAATAFGYDGWEVETWFANYTDDNTAIVLFDLDSHRMLVIVDRHWRAERRIQGLGELQ